MKLYFRAEAAPRGEYGSPEGVHQNRCEFIQQPLTKGGGRFSGLAKIGKGAAGLFEAGCARDDALTKIGIYSW